MTPDPTPEELAQSVVNDWLVHWRDVPSNRFHLTTEQSAALVWRVATLLRQHASQAGRVAELEAAEKVAKCAAKIDDVLAEFDGEVHCVDSEHWNALSAAIDKWRRKVERARAALGKG